MIILIRKASGRATYEFCEEEKVGERQEDEALNIKYFGFFKLYHY